MLRNTLHHIICHCCYQIMTIMIRWWWWTWCPHQIKTSTLGIITVGLSHLIIASSGLTFFPLPPLPRFFPVSRWTRSRKLSTSAWMILRGYKWMIRILGGWTLEITLESLCMPRVPPLPGLLLWFFIMSVMACAGERISIEKDRDGLLLLNPWEIKEKLEVNGLLIEWQKRDGKGN